MTTVFADPTLVDEHFRGLVATRRPQANQASLAWALRAARAWLGEEVADGPAGMRRYAADLRLGVGDQARLATFRKAALVDFGEMNWLNNGWEATVSWRAASLAPLFPVFSGRIAALSDELVLSGWYAPPGGAAGRAADAILMHVAAKGTARWLLRAIDEAAVTAVSG